MVRTTLSTLKVPPVGEPTRLTAAAVLGYELAKPTILMELGATPVTVIILEATLVQLVPLPPVTVTLYVLVEVGATVIVPDTPEFHCPVLHLKPYVPLLLPLLAVKVVLVPLQTEFTDTIEATGGAFTIKVLLPVLVQPLCPVMVTVYVVVVVGAIVLCPVVTPSFQTNETPA